MKSTVILDGLALLLVDVLVDHFVGDGARCHGKISARPQVPAPLLLLQVRKLLEQHSRTRSLEPLNNPANILMGAIADEHVHMISRNFSRDDFQLVLRRNPPQKIANSGHLPCQHSLAVFRADEP